MSVIYSFLILLFQLTFIHYPFENVFNYKIRIRLCPKQSEEEFVEELMKRQTRQIYVGGFSSLIKTGC